MQYWSICLFIIFFSCLSAKGQQTAPTADIKKAGDTSISFIRPYPTLFSYQPSNTNSYKTLPSSFYTDNLSFFCKKELQVEKAVKFPVRMRLGSVTYTDKLEGKITVRSTE